MIKFSCSIKRSSKQFLFIGGWLLSACLAQPCDSYAENSKPMRNPFLPPAPQTAKLPVAVTPMQEINIYRLNYALAQDIRESLSGIFADNSMTCDAATNSLIFSGNAAEHQQLRRLLPKLDAATKQITLEAKLIAVNDEYTKQLGINWNWDKLPQKAENDNDEDNDYEGDFKFWNGYSFRFNATLNALIADGKAKILARPRIITIPGHEASIFIGDHIPVQTEKHDSSGTYTSTEYIDAGIQLKYLPIVSTTDNMVTAQVHTEVSTPTLISELKNYRITSRTANTNVRMRSGETLIIGGLINEEEQRSLQKVPLLSNIPLLGELFKSRTTKKSKIEVIMLLTPYITEAGESPAIYNSDNNINDAIVKKAFTKSKVHKPKESLTKSENSTKI